MKYLLCITLIALLCVGISAQTASRTDEADTMKRAVDFITASKKRPSVDIVLRDMREINGKIVRVYDDSFAVEFKEYSRHITKVVIIGSIHYNPKPQKLIKYSDVLQIEGKDFERICTERQPSSSEVVDWLRQAGQALDKAHQEKIVHRDLKPENIFLAERQGLPPIVKVLDFGVAKLLPEGDAASAKAVRTASLQAVNRELVARAQTLAAAPDPDFSLARDGKVVWHGAPVARIIAGSSPLKPKVQLIADDTLAGEERDGVVFRVEKFLSRVIE